ncbi:hypothetical protein VKT23_001326 [Stygiomarasmius scandens]|uniref:Uncharacterized protein n=1 Tax=Marasmiellus scandens TaxID=2682957 RepID=A0ABR1K730_9AGAR
MSNPRGATSFWSTHGRREEDYHQDLGQSLATYRFGDPIVDDGHDPGSTHNTNHRSHQSQQQQTRLLSHHAEVPPMSPENLSEFGDYSDEEDFEDYSLSGDDGGSALCIEVSSVQIDTDSIVEGPAVVGPWPAPSVITSTAQSFSSTSQDRRTSGTWSLYSGTSSSSNDWRRLLGPVNPSTTTVATPPEFAFTDDTSHYTHDVHDQPQSQTDVDAMYGFDVRYITDLSSSPDVISRPTQLDPAKRRSLHKTPYPTSPSPSDPSRNPIPFSPAILQLRSSEPRRQRPVSIQSNQTTNTFALDDSFHRGLMDWGGALYGSMRREWVIKKNKDKCRYQNQSQNYQSQLWKGMFPGDEEVWTNYLLGNFLVSREEILSDSSSRGHTSQHNQSRHSATSSGDRDGSSSRDKSHMQQRLIIRRLKDEPAQSNQPKSSQSAVSGSAGANAVEGTTSSLTASTSPSVSAISSSLYPTSANSASDPSFGALALSQHPGSIHPGHERTRTESSVSATPSVSVSGPSTSSIGPSLTRVVSSGTEASHGSSGSGSASGSGSSASTHTHRSTNTNITNLTRSSANNASTKGRPKVNSDSRHPPVIIHKHSKVVAFSISRHYRAGKTTEAASSPSSSGQAGRSTRGREHLGVSSSTTTRASGSKERGDKDKVDGVRRSQIVMLATRGVQEQFHDAYSKAKTTKDLLVGAGLAVDKKVMSEKQRDRDRELREREKEKERERTSKGKGKEKEKSRSPQIPTNVPPSLAKHKSSDFAMNRDGKNNDDRGRSAADDTLHSFGLGTGLLHSKNSSSALRAGPSNVHLSKATRSMPERATKGLEGVDLDNEKHSHTLPSSRAARYNETEKEQQEQQQPQQQSRPTRPRLRSFVQPQQSRVSPTQTQQETQSAQSKPNLLKRLFQGSASSSATASASKQGSSTATSSVGSVGNGAGTGHAGKNGSLSVSSTMAGPASPMRAPTSREEEVNAQQQKILNSLEESFENIGLLPSVHDRGRDRDRERSRTDRSTRDSIAGRDQNKKGKGWLGQRRIIEEEDTDVLGHIPQDALFMILPLWPEETDVYSQKAQPFVLPEISDQEKRYLIVFYKPMQKEEEVALEGRQRGKEKEREKENEPGHGHGQSKSIMLSSFTVVALTVSFEELQALRVTLPKEGLMVTGPLEDAFRSIPGRTPLTDMSTRKCLLAHCNSRETGLEYYPDALLKLGLCSVVSDDSDNGVPNPLPLGRVSEEFDSQKSVVVKLTSLGSAVSEMIWCGALAVTSFGT